MVDDYVVRGAERRVTHARDLPCKTMPARGTERISRELYARAFTRADPRDPCGSRVGARDRGARHLLAYTAGPGVRGRLVVTSKRLDLSAAIPASVISVAYAKHGCQ